MKTIIVGFLSICLCIFVGCKSIPTTDGMYETSYAVGTATGLICNMTKIDDTSRNAIVEIINIVDDCVPETNQTFEATWTPIAKAHTQQLIDEGKIDETQGTLILLTFKTVTKGIDYVFDVRFPKARQYADLVEAAIHGFTDGFLTVFKPADTFASNVVPIDQQAYRYLLSTKKK